MKTEPCPKEGTNTVGHAIKVCNTPCSIEDDCYGFTPPPVQFWPPEPDFSLGGPFVFESPRGHIHD